MNAWASVHPLPPEYLALELTQFEPWTALDSLACAKLIAFGLAFDLGDLDRTIALESYVTALGPDAGRSFGRAVRALSMDGRRLAARWSTNRRVSRA